MSENLEKMLSTSKIQIDGGILLSIIIPVYNLENYIKKCLDSILDSNIMHYEVICINDGSTDGSQLILSSYSHHPNITIISQPNMGVSATRNLGISKANGKYIWFIDGDDFVESSGVTIAISKLSQDPDLLYLSYDCIIEGASNDDGNINNIRVDKSMLVEEFLGSYYGGQGMPWSFIIRRSIVLSHSLRFDTSIKYYEDEQFIYKVISRSRSIISTSALIYHYLIRPSSALRTSSKKGRLNDALRVYLDLKRFSRSEPWYYQLFIDTRVTHKMCWIFRISDTEYAKDFFIEAKLQGVFPLRIIGPFKTRIQAKLLNKSFRLFRLFSMLNNIREVDK